LPRTSEWDPWVIAFTTLLRQIDNRHIVSQLLRQ
jgi:hypothetical protein